MLDVLQVFRISLFKYVRLFFICVGLFYICRYIYGKETYVYEKRDTGTNVKQFVYV